MSINNFPPASAKPATPTISGTVFGLAQENNSNVALGYNALGSDNAASPNTNGNVAVGKYALVSTTQGIGNVAIGLLSLQANQGGGNNVAIGYQSGYSATGSGNIFIGNTAGSDETGSNKLYIANNSTSNPLIYGDFDTGKLTINGSLRLERPVREKVNVVSGSFSGYTLNFQSNGAIHYLTSNASSNGTVNIRPESGVTTDSWLDIGDSFTVVLQITNGSIPYYPTAWQIDGTSVTPMWQGGTAPSAGNPASIDVYSMTITKTASATYTVLGSQTKFA